MESKKIIEHKFFVLDTEERNKNHRFYGDEVVDCWLKDERLTGDSAGIDIEFALEENADIENEYLIDHLSCGLVTKLEKKGTKLFAFAKFKKVDITAPIYNKEIKVEDLTLIPKGKGSVKNQRVQDDYELFGFNLVKKSESAFIIEKKEEKETEKSS